LTEQEVTEIIMKYTLANLCITGAMALTASSDVYGEGFQMNSGWYAVNDDVMGGVSKGKALPYEDGSVRFMGAVSFENNGGFASIRRQADFLELNDSDGIMLNVRGDGKRYQFRVRTSQLFDGLAYKHDFDTVDGQWVKIVLEWKNFVPTFRGRKVSGAPALIASEIEQLGFLIADKQDGSFDLQVQEIIPVLFEQ
jgi:monofunctional biosynthetic peptidoglycan transglycosylase